MTTIKTPPYNWFVNKSDNKPVTNIYSGSCGTDPKKGVAHLKTFNYKVYVVDIGTENAKFVAECYSVAPWNAGYKKEDISNKEATCSVNDLLELNEWLNQEHKKFIEKATSRLH